MENIESRVYLGMNQTLIINGKSVPFAKIDYQFSSDGTAEIEITEIGPNKFFTLLLGKIDTKISLKFARNGNRDEYNFLNCNLYKIKKIELQDVQGPIIKSEYKTHDIRITRLTHWWQRPEYKVLLSENKKDICNNSSGLTDEIIQQSYFFKAESFEHYSR
jgi:hypothetical protein